MKQHYELIVVIPVGPNTKLEFIKDSIDSIYFYCRCALKIVLSDDSLQNLGEAVKADYPEIDVLVNKKSHGLAGGLYIHLSKVFKYILQNYRFDTLLKFDTDALITGFDPQKDAAKMFEKHPSIGMAGMHKLRTEPRDFKNNKIDNIWPRNHIMRATCTWRIIKRPIGNLALRKYFFKALTNGYELGENIFGASYFVNEPLLQQMEAAKMLPDSRLGNSRLEEDHIFSMLAKVLNFDLGDLESGDLPFACALKKLPASPEELHQKGKKIIHSTRSWGDMEEKEIRQFFKNIRDAESAKTIS